MDPKTWIHYIEQERFILPSSSPKMRRVSNLIRQALDLTLAIALPYSQRYQEPLVDLTHEITINGHAGVAYSLS